MSGAHIYCDELLISVTMRHDDLGFKDRPTNNLIFKDIPTSDIGVKDRPMTDLIFKDIPTSDLGFQGQTYN